MFADDVSILKTSTTVSEADKQTPPADKTELGAAINNASMLISSKTTGTAPGNVPQGAKGALQAAIDEAKLVKNDPSVTQEAVDAQVALLDNAISAFNNAVISVVIEQGTNIVINPGFENGTAGWGNIGGGGTVSADAVAPYAGTYSGKITGRSVVWHGFSQDVLSALKASGQGSYNVSVWIKVSSGSQPVSIQLDYVDGSGEHWNHLATGIAETDYTNIFNSTEISWMGDLKSAVLQICMADGGSATADINLDEVVVSKAADKTTLESAIADAAALIGSKTAGTAIGNVSQAAKDTYQTAIDAAVAVNDNPVHTQAEIDAQVAALAAAATAFNNAVITSAPVSSNPGTQTPTQGQGQTTDQVPGIITVKPALNGKTAEAKVEASALEKAFNEVVKDADGVKTVTIKVPAVINASGYYQQLPADIFTHSKTNGADVSKRIEINTPIGTVVIPDNMVKANDVSKAGYVGISIAAADTSKLSKQIKDQIGNKPVIELTAYVDGKKIAWKNADAPVTISVGYKPTAEELKNPECITVWYIDGNGKVNSVPSGRYDAATGKVTFTTTHFSTYAVAYNYRTFDDTGKYNWAQKQIGFVAAKGIIDGTSETLFSPGVNITRAQFLDALVKALGLSAEFESNFRDVKVSANYYETLGIAKKLGITSGTGNNKFSPDAQISRQEMATLVVRAMKIAGKLNTGGTASDLKKYTDASKIAKYAAESMAALVKEGILQGADNKLNPSGKLTRAEAAVVLNNIYHMQ